MHEVTICIIELEKKTILKYIRISTRVGYIIELLQESSIFKNYYTSHVEHVGQFQLILNF